MKPEDVIITYQEAKDIAEEQYIRDTLFWMFGSQLWRGEITLQEFKEYEQKFRESRKQQLEKPIL